mmetsp:Transcript_91523/g.197915  ORF Transcript_91523/g.197915 Transcript_91523/m.197915 type:complete len:124 (+) Transcript_91523:289-660(+)
MKLSRVVLSTEVSTISEVDLMSNTKLQEESGWFHLIGTLKSADHLHDELFNVKAENGLKLQRKVERYRETTEESGQVRRVWSEVSNLNHRNLHGASEDFIASSQVFASTLTIGGLKCHPHLLT